MYLLMPAQPGIDFVSLAVVFILATLLGFASHAPGSLGVFDAAMLVALPQFGREQLVATLVVFRILYFHDPVRNRDNHHGHARVMAERGQAMAGAPSGGGSRGSGEFRLRGTDEA